MGQDRRVAEHDTDAFDENGHRRFIRAGDPIPDPWQVEGEEKPKPSKPKTAKKVW